MAQSTLVKVEGLTTLRKDIDKMCTDQKGPLFSTLKAAGYAAVQPIVPAARDRIPTSSRPRSQYHRPDGLANSIRASAYRSGAAVRMGGKGEPEAGWMEFGGSRRKPHASSRDFVKNGRYLFPAARGLSASASSQYTKALNEVFGSGRVWTNTTDNPEAVA